MKSVISKKDTTLNFLFVVFYMVLIVFAGFTEKLVTMVMIFLVAYTLFVLYSKIKLRKMKYMLASPGFVYGSIFLPYVLFAVFMFILDGYKSRIHYFVNNIYTMQETTKIYLYSYLVLVILLTLFNCIKKYDIKAKVDELEIKVMKIFSGFSILDVLIFSFAMINLVKFISMGTAFFSLTTLQKRNVFSSEINHYINLFMTMYSLLVTIYFVNNQERKKKVIMIFRIMSLIIYWGIFLTCERRMFVAYLMGFIIVMVSKLDKIKIKNIILSILIVVILLLSASFRGNINFSNNKVEDVLYMSLTEFICTYSVSNYYVNNIGNIDLLYGETYVKNSFMSLFPRAILPNKPEELGTTFKNMLNLNVGYSFNPMAEGILNFGRLAIIMVPVIILCIVLFANKSYKFNVLLPVIISAFSIDFYRGQFANFFFDSIFCLVLLFLIFKISYRKGSVLNYDV